MQNIYAQDQKNVMSYVWKQCVLVKSSNIMKHFLRIIEDDGTNESIEDFDYPVTHLLPLDFVIYTMGIWNRIYSPIVIMRKMNIKLIKSIFCTNAPGWVLRFLHIFYLSSNYLENLWRQAQSGVIISSLPKSGRKHKWMNSMLEEKKSQKIPYPCPRRDFI